jgi:hypothetical protein
MIGKLMSLGFGLATLPARMTYKGTKAMLAVPGDFEQLRAEIRQASDQVARQIQALMADVDVEMSRKSAHLNGEQKQQAAELALDAAQKHLSMAAVDILRALWLAADSSRSLEQDREGVIIEHEPHERRSHRR